MAPQPPRPPHLPRKPVPKPPVPPKPQKQRYRLTEDHRSSVRTETIYGLAKDIVTEVSVSDPVVIVQAADGNRYPIHKSKLEKL